LLELIVNSSEPTPPAMAYSITLNGA
jgi:hypothetical protein